MNPADLKSARATLGLSQAELGHRIGVTRNTINRWEMGLHPIPRWAEMVLQKNPPRRSSVPHAARAI